MKQFVVKVFRREVPDDGKLSDPANYTHVGTDTIQAWHPKNGVETAATRFNQNADGQTHRIKVGDIVALGGTSFEFRIMGWIEHSDPEFIGALGIQGDRWSDRWKRKVETWKVMWERSKSK